MCLRVQDWFKGVGLLDFLRDVGKYARVGTMLSRDSVRSRMEQDNEGMSFTEYAPRCCGVVEILNTLRAQGLIFH